MRPVNLIPDDQRRRDRGGARAGAASYLVLALLIAVLFAVTGVVLTGNDVRDKEAELASLEAKQSETEARAEALSSFASFQSMKDARVETVTSLAQSRFDWERVMRELSLVLPASVWFTNVTGTVAPEVTLPKTANSSLRSTVPGPALELIGCARTQQDVAELITAIGDIDGVTRVLVERSEKPDAEITGSGESEGVNEDCRTRDFIAKFQLVAAFDGVVAGASAPPSADPAATGSEAAETTTAPSSTDPATDVPQQEEAQASVDAGSARAKKAAGLVGAGDGG